MIYYYIYFVLAIISILDLAKCKTNLKNYLFIATILLLICFSGLRFDTGWDYKGYQYYYAAIIPDGGIDEHLAIWGDIYFEPLFKLIMFISKYLGIDYYQFQFIVASISLLLISRSTINIVPDKKLLFSLLLYSLSFLFLFMSTIRQGLAAAFLLYAISCYLKNKNIIVFFVLIIVSSLFHYSAFLFLIVPLITNVRSTKVLFFILAISIVLYTFNIQWMKNILMTLSDISPPDIRYKILVYLQDERFNASRNIGWGIIEKILTLALIIFLLLKKNITKKEILFFNIYIIYIIIYFLFFEVTIVYDRMRLYFVFLSIPSYILIYSRLQSIPRALFHLYIIALSFFSLYLIFSSQSNREIFIPYHSVLEDENIIPEYEKGLLRANSALEIDRR